MRFVIELNKMDATLYISECGYLAIRHDTNALEDYRSLFFWTIIKRSFLTCKFYSSKYLTDTKLIMPMKSFLLGHHSYICKKTIVSNMSAKDFNSQENRFFSFEFRLIWNQVCFVPNLLLYFNTNLKHILNKCYTPIFSYFGWIIKMNNEA